MISDTKNAFLVSPSPNTYTFCINYKNYSLPLYINQCACMIYFFYLCTQCDNDADCRNRTFLTKLIMLPCHVAIKSKRLEKLKTTKNIILRPNNFHTITSEKGVLTSAKFSEFSKLGTKMLPQISSGLKNRRGKGFIWRFGFVDFSITRCQF